MGSFDNWRTQNFRQTIITKIEEVIQTSAVQVARSSSEMENHAFIKAKTREEYLIIVAKMILHIKEVSQQSQNHVSNMPGQDQNQARPSNQDQTQQEQPQQGSSNQAVMATDQ